jgi:hypothetical protein
MKRCAQEPQADRASLGDRLRQGLGTEPIKPRPQRDVRVSRHLRLHRDQPFDGVERLHPAPAEQHLPFEQGSVQGPTSERARAGPRQVVCVPALTQFGRQVSPPSYENACSQRLADSDRTRHS